MQIKMNKVITIILNGMTCHDTMRERNGDTRLQQNKYLTLGWACSLVAPILLLNSPSPSLSLTIWQTEF